MNAIPKVSVITIFLNEETFIKEAIDSVLAQTYENWELLLVDDGSTDESREIAQGYAEKYPQKVLYLEHPDHQNKGMSASRNLALGTAKGELISFIDADDYWFPHKLQYQVRNLEDHPEAAMVCSPAQLWYSWTNKLEDRKKDFVQEYPIGTGNMLEAPQLFQLFLANEFFSICDVLVRKTIVEAVGGYDDAFRDMYEDQVFHTKICLRYPIYISTEAWYRYRRHPGSCTHQSLRSEDHSLKRNRFLDWLRGYMAENGFDTPELKKNLNDAQWRYKHPLASKLISQPNKKGLKDLVNGITRSILPKNAYRWFYNQCRFKHWPPVGWIRFGSMRRLTPIGFWYTKRGTTIDRYYISKFLEKNKDHIQGHVLEIGEATYTWSYGGNSVTKSDVLHVVPGNPRATMVGDLTDPDFIDANKFDCVILTQTMMMIFDFQKAIQSIYRILKPGGKALITNPGISQMVTEDHRLWLDHWRFTEFSMRQLFSDVFPDENLTIESYGNVLAATGFLHGIAAEELKQSELNHHDPQFPVILSLVATKPKD